MKKGLIFERGKYIDIKYLTFDSIIMYDTILQYNFKYNVYSSKSDFATMEETTIPLYFYCGKEISEKLKNKEDEYLIILDIYLGNKHNSHRVTRVTLNYIKNIIDTYEGSDTSNIVYFEVLLPYGNISILDSRFINLSKMQLDANKIS